MRLRALAFLALTASSCAHRLVPPPPAARVPASPRLPVVIRDFLVIGAGPSDSTSDRIGLETSFEQHLAAVETSPSAHAGHVIAVDVRVDVERTLSRTYVLDVLAAYPFLGLFPLTPEWGEAIVHVVAQPKLARADGNRWVNVYELPPLEVRVTSEFSTLFYSWWRTEPQEEAFQAAFSRAFSEVARKFEDMIRRAEPHLIARNQEPPPPPPPEPKCTSSGAFVASPGASPWFRSSFTSCKDANAKPPLPANVESVETSRNRQVAETPRNRPDDFFVPLALSETATRAAPAPIPTATSTPMLVESRPPLPSLDDLTTPTDVLIEESGVRVIVHPVGSQRKSLWEQYLASLGGVEASAFMGLASVTTRVSTKNQANELVGAGSAGSAGYRISLYRPPEKTGLFFPASLGFLSEDIQINGFLEEMPVAQVDAAQTVGARITDPDTGLEDIEPVSYFLHLKSGYFTQNVVANLVIGTDDVQFFATARVGLNLVELRSLKVDFFDGSESVTDVRGFLSGSGGAQLGVSILPIRTALRASFDVEWHNRFEYPNRIDFYARPAFDPVENIYEREQAWADAVSFFAFNAQISGVFLF